MKSLPGNHSSTVLILLTSVALFNVAHAQVDRSGLTGIVADSSGAVLPDVKVIALLDATGLQRETTTSNTGVYSLPNLPVGSYTVSFNRGGFAPVTYLNLKQTVGQTRKLDVERKVRGVIDDMQVSGDTTPLEETSAAVGERIEPVQTNDLPLNGRNCA